MEKEGGGGREGREGRERARRRQEELKEGGRVSEGLFAGGRGRELESNEYIQQPLTSPR